MRPCRWALRRNCSLRLQSVPYDVFLRCGQFLRWDSARRWWFRNVLLTRGLLPDVPADKLQSVPDRLPEFLQTSLHGSSGDNIRQ